MIVDLIGFTAGILMTITMIPQIVKSYKTKSVKDISLLMLVLYVIAALLWMIYGILIKSAPVAIMDGLTFIIGLTQVFMKIKYEK